jgi:twitching motility protein PilT
MLIQTAITDLIHKKSIFTDLQIRVGEPLMVRTPAGWESHTQSPLEAGDVEKFVELVAGSGWKDLLDKSPTQALDIAKTLGGIARLRCNIAYSGGTDCDSETETNAVEVLIRKLPVNPPAFRDLGLPAEVLKGLLTQKGLWVIAGPTGNGKSTTVASILSHINETQSKHIITIEQPIEYILRPKKSIVSQKEVGRHVPSFFRGLEAAMRQRPDVLMIGEVRDADTMETMLQGAESGHLVLATTHTKNVEDTLSKLAGFLQGRGENKIATLASTLCGIVSQYLVPTADGKSLVMAYEILFNSTEVQNVIRKGDYQKLANVMSENRKLGSVLLNERLRELVDTRVITNEVAMNTAYDQAKFKKDMYA